jgi:hypothetical protein
MDEWHAEGCIRVNREVWSDYTSIKQVDEGM